MTAEIIVRRRTGVRLLESSRVEGDKRLPTHHTTRSPCTADFLLPQIKNESYTVKLISLFVLNFLRAPLKAALTSWVLF